CAVEVEPYRREILMRRQRDGVLPVFPIWDDVRTFDGTAWRGVVDLVSAGFPCQPFSRAGRRQRESHAEWLWDEIVRIARECEPHLVFLENSPSIQRHGLRRI